MHIIIMIVVGFIVGLIARAIVPGKHHMGVILTTALGIAGGLLGGYINHLIGWHGTWLMSILGAVVVLVIAGFIKHKGGE